MRGFVVNLSVKWIPIHAYNVFLKALFEPAEETRSGKELLKMSRMHFLFCPFFQYDTRLKT